MVQLPTLTLFSLHEATETSVVRNDALVAPRVARLTSVESHISSLKPAFVASVDAIVEINRRSILVWNWRIIYSQSRPKCVWIVWHQRLPVHRGIAVWHLTIFRGHLGNSIESSPRRVRSTWPTHVRQSNDSAGHHDVASH